MFKQGPKETGGRDREEGAVAQTDRARIKKKKGRVHDRHTEGVEETEVERAKLRL